MKQTAYAKIPTSIRAEWMQYELESFESFKAVNHYFDHDDHVYCLICSSFSTDLVIRGETSLVALIISANNATFRQENSHHWQQVWDALQNVVFEFSLSETAKSVISQYMKIEKKQEKINFVRFLNTVDFNGTIFEAGTVIEVVESHSDHLYVTGTQLCEASLKQLPELSVDRFEMAGTKVGFQSRHYNEDEGWSMWITTMDLQFEKHYRKDNFEIRSLFHLEQ